MKVLINDMISDMVPLPFVNSMQKTFNFVVCVNKPFSMEELDVQKVLTQKW